MTPSQNIRYVFELSENGTDWISYTGNFYSDAQAYVEVSQPGITSLTVNTQIRVRYTTNFSSGSLPNTSDPTTISVVVNPLPAQPTISASSYTICQNQDIQFSSTTTSGIVSTTWTSSNNNYATVGSSGLVHAVSQGNSIITYTITDANGCQSKDAKPVTVNPTPAIANIIDAVCSGSPYTNNPSLTLGNFVPTGTKYDWGVPSTTAIGLNGTISGTTQDNIHAALTNTTNDAITANYTITATKGSCVSTPFTLALTVTSTPYITNRPIINACSGTSFSDEPVNGSGNIVPSGIQYSWSAPTVPTGITNHAASGTPSPTTFGGLLNNSTNGTITVTYQVQTYNAGCTGTSFTETVLVNPTPIISIKTATICSNDPFNITISNGVDLVPVNTTYTWVAPSVSGINGLQAGNNLSVVSGALSNTTNGTISVTYSITPKSGACPGLPFNAVVTVNPMPVILDRPYTPANQTGSGSSFNFLLSQQNNEIIPTGTTYSWPQPSLPLGLTGGAASGTPSPTSLTGTLFNPSGGYLDATYTITPSYSSCIGNSFTFVVRVYPKPIIGLKQTAICSGTTFTIIPTDGPPDNDVVPSTTRYTWGAPSVIGITGTASGTSQTSIYGTLTNLTNTAIIVEYTVTPIAAPQAGLDFKVLVTVNPLPSLTSLAAIETSSISNNDGLICSDASATLTPVLGAGNASDFKYLWTAPGGLTIPETAASYTTAIPAVGGRYDLKIENLATQCQSATVSKTITVYQIPTVGSISGPKHEVCVEESTILTASGHSLGNPPYVTYWWYTDNLRGSTPSATVTVTGRSAGAGEITYSVEDSKKCISVRSSPFALTVNPLPAIPTAVPSIAVYDGFAHYANATVTEANVVVDWYDAITAGSASGTPSQTVVGTNTQYAEAKNTITGCISSSAVLNRPRRQVTSEVTAATLTLTANNKQKIYNKAIYSAGYDMSATGFVANESFGNLSGTATYSGTSQTAVYVGSYPIIPSGYTSTNYRINYVNGTLTIDKKNINVPNAAVITKVYDATRTATLTGTAFQTAIAAGTGTATDNKPYIGDNIQLDYTANYQTKTAELNPKPVDIVYTFTTGSADAGNYTLIQPVGITGYINKKVIDEVNPDGIDKKYDGTDIAVGYVSSLITPFSSPGTGSANDKKAYSGDDVSLISTALYASKNVGSRAISSTSTLAGNDAINYDLTRTVSPLSKNITVKNLTMSGLSVPLSKVYDGTTKAVVAGVVGQLITPEAGAVGTAEDGAPYIGDAVVLTGTLSGTAVGTYNSKDVSTANSVTYSGISLTGAQAGNYTLTIQSPSAATITPKTIDFSGLSVAPSKIYDGTTYAAVIGNLGTLRPAEPVNTGSVNDNTPYQGDAISLSGPAIATYNSKDVVSASSVSFSGVVLTGAQSSNYSLTAHAIFNAAITKKTIDEVSPVSIDKVYDATNYALGYTSALKTKINPAPGTSGDGAPYNGDDIAVVSTALFATKNVGSSAISSTSTLTGAQIGNYTLNRIQSVQARTIIAKALTMSGLYIATPKIYDATADANVSGTPNLLSAELAGTGSVEDGKPYNNDQVSIIGTPIGVYNSKDVATANEVSFSGLSLSGVDANNYSLTIQPNYASTITPKALSMFGLSVPSSKMYDGNTISRVNGTPSLFSAVSTSAGNIFDGKPYIGDNVFIAGTPNGNYNSKDVGIASYVKYSGLILSGTHATNYTLNTQGNDPSIITPMGISVRADAQTKIYGEDDPFFTFSNDSLVNGDSFSGLLSRVSGEDVGSYQIQQGTLTLGPNYTITYIPNTLSVFKAYITIKPNPVKRTYGDLPLPAVATTTDFTITGLKYNESIKNITINLPLGVGSGNDMKDPAVNYVSVVQASDPQPGTANLNNYNIELIPGDIVVKKYPITISAEPKEKRKNQIDPLFTYVLSRSLVEGDSLSGSLTRQSGENVGFYTILQGSLKINDNYAITYVPADLEILTIERVVVVPNAFTPNNDGLNDVIKAIHNSTIVSFNYFKIFDRSGRQIFETRNINDGWDGKLNGVVAESDAYFWIIEYNTWDNKVYQTKGSFVLIK